MTPHEIDPTPDQAVDPAVARTVDAVAARAADAAAPLAALAPAGRARALDSVADALEAIRPELLPVAE
ncbi:aldehyde dehydrogenase (NADP(+)), partial [Clavibacter nebraskensis]